jgi:hypothetical protein
MIVDTDAYEFDPGNRAYQRLRNLVLEHFNVFEWADERTGRHLMLSLLDLDSGDAFTVAIMDSEEERDPYTLLAVTTTGRLRAYGPFAGGTAASAATARLALADPEVYMALALPLRHPGDTTIPDGCWSQSRPELAGADPDRCDTAPTIVVLHDDRNGRLAAVGPFDDPAAATSWRPTGHGRARRMVVAVRPTPAEAPPAGQPADRRMP